MGKNNRTLIYLIKLFPYDKVRENIKKEVYMEISRYETNYKNKLFFSETRIKEKDIPKRFESKLINIYPEVEYQELLGFGGAITEASGYAYSKLDSEKKERFIQDYFSEDGLNYSLA